MYNYKHSAVSNCAYQCSKNALAALNTLYIFIAIILISVAIYAKLAAILTSLPILGGVLASGVFLLLLAIVGLAGAIKHNQVILFFYMVILVLLFIIQLSVSISALAINNAQQKKLLQKAWEKSTSKTKADVMKGFDCCGFEDASVNDHPNCSTIAPCCKGQPEENCLKHCTPCFTQVEERIDHVLSVSGGVGLFFSFTLLFGVYLAHQYRNQKDPRANPSAFL